MPSGMRAAICQGITEDLKQRGKTVETPSDSEALMCRWVKQLLHQELDSAREACPASGVDIPVDLDVEFSMEEAEQPSMIAKAEQQAATLLQKLRSSEHEQAAEPL